MPSSGLDVLERLAVHVYLSVLTATVIAITAAVGRHRWSHASSSSITHAIAASSIALLLVS
jgi:hypothetical protein